MGTRTNFYKNPSFSYKKDFSLSSVLRNLRAYNHATGCAPPNPIDEQPPTEEKTSRRKRPRLERSTPDDWSRRIGEEDDGPMSHQDYIERRRREVCSSQVYEELDAHVLGATDSGANLVGYESDDGASSECKGDDPLDSGQKTDGDQIKSRSQQRLPLAGEPICVVCGRYGEYICDETDDDICSLECKVELLQGLRPIERSSSNRNAPLSSSEVQSSLPAPDLAEDTWDYNHHRWSKKTSSLCTYECWKCRRPGHLAEDCLATTSNGQIEMGQSNSIPRDIIVLYRRCHQIGKDLSTASCNTCRSSMSLATCLDCSRTLCDNAGHVDEHIGRYPSHQQYYSHKLRRLVKCCKSTCKVTEIKDLLVCHHCFDKAFDKFYDMYTATWKGAGLSMICNSICCEDHFAWHRMNCPNADVEDTAYIINRNAERGKCVQLSDFIF